MRNNIEKNTNLDVDEIRVFAVEGLCETIELRNNDRQEGYNWKADISLWDQCIRRLFAKNCQNLLKSNRDVFSSMPTVGVS